MRTYGTLCAFLLCLFPLSASSMEARMTDNREKAGFVFRMPHGVVGTWNCWVSDLIDWSQRDAVSPGSTLSVLFADSRDTGKAIYRFLRVLMHTQSTMTGLARPYRFALMMKNVSSPYFSK